MVPFRARDRKRRAASPVYGDYFARPGKRSGTWMSALRTQYELDGEFTPLILNNCNYNEPAPGEPMPGALLPRLNGAANAKSGFDNVQFIASASLDLAYHRLTDEEILGDLDVNALEDGVLAQAGKPYAIEMRHRSPHFLQSFAGELYAGGYRTYLGAGVLDNDGFAAFAEVGDPSDPAFASRLSRVRVLGGQHATGRADPNF